MHPCFDAVRWQGLGEAIRALSVDEQVWLVWEFASMAATRGEEHTPNQILIRLSTVIAEGIHAECAE